MAPHIPNYQMPNCDLNVKLTGKEFPDRRKDWQALPPNYTSGTLTKFGRLEGSAVQGTVTKFGTRRAQLVGLDTQGVGAQT